MGESIIVALISGGLALLGTFLSVYMSGRKTEENMRISQAVTDTKIEELTREVRKHNGFAERLPVLEEKINALGERVDDLEEVVRK